MNVSIEKRSVVRLILIALAACLLYGISSGTKIDLCKRPPDDNACVVHFRDLPDPDFMVDFLKRETCASRSER